MSMIFDIMIGYAIGVTLGNLMVIVVKALLGMYK